MPIPTRPFNPSIERIGAAAVEVANEKAFTAVGIVLVLDEADRMVDIGFIKEIKTIISLLPNQRQSLFFSATVSKKVEEIIRLFVKNPITISVKKQDTNANIQQNIVRVPKHIKKVDQLHDLLISQGFEKVLVFLHRIWYRDFRSVHRHK